MAKFKVVTADEVITVPEVGFVEIIEDGSLIFATDDPEYGGTPVALFKNWEYAIEASEDD